MGYGGENRSPNSEEWGKYFARGNREDSVFGKKVLRLKYVWTMAPWTVVEYIPASWDEIDIVIYHGYRSNFNMDNKLNIKVTPMSQINQENSFEEVWSTSWPLSGWEKKPKNKMISEHVTTLKVPQRLRQEDYAIHIEVYAFGGN